MSALSKRLPSWLAGLIVLAIAAVLLELLLQVLSFGAFLLYKKPSLEESSGREGKVVFCVGDSFTFGYGASDLSKSYPNCLENYLEQETGEPWTVVNCGYPGRNSSQMGEALTQAVISGPAEFVVLVGGVNDSWSGAIRLEINTLNAALTAGRGGENRQLTDQYQWRFRTLRLLKTLRKRNAFGNESVAKATSEQSPNTIRQSIPGSETASPTSISTSATPSEETGQAEVLSAQEEWPGAKALRLYQAGDLEAAIAIYQSLPDAETGYSAVNLIDCFVRLGRLDDAIARVNSLRAAYQANPTEQSSCLLLSALKFTGKNGEIMELAPVMAKQFPESFEIAFRHGLALMTDTQVLAARAEFDRAVPFVEAPQAEDSGMAAWFWKNRAVVFGYQPGHPFDSDKVAESYVKGMLAGEKEDSALQGLLGMVGTVTNDQFENAISASEATDEQQRKIRGLIAKARDTSLEAKGAEVTKHNMITMARFAKQDGAEVIISTYPFSSKLLVDAQKAASKEGPTYFLRINDDFAQIVETEGRAHLFVADGHCNDRGYQLMAELIGARLLEAVQ